jgi:transcriptional regulator with XRE-family HTH domain
MLFFEKLEKLCKLRGISVSKLAQDIGKGSATATGWRQGSQPQASTLKLIADRLGVDVDYFLDEDAAEPIDYENVDTATFNQAVWQQLLKAHKYEKRKAIKAYLEFDNAQTEDAMNDPDRLAIYNHGENSWAIGNAHAPIKVINGKEHPLSDMEAELLRIFAELPVVEQAKLLAFAAELKSK